MEAFPTAGEGIVKMIKGSGTGLDGLLRLSQVL